MKHIHEYLENSLLKDYNDGADSPSRRKTIMKNLLEETNSPGIKNRSPNGSKASLIKPMSSLPSRDQSLTKKEQLLNERSGSDLSALSIKGIQRLPHIILLS